jgi:sugar lactone lactonase YvrE
MAASFGGPLRTAVKSLAITLGLIGGCAAALAQTPLLPSALAYDAQGNLYYTDADRNQVYELSSQGALTVFAGSGAQGISGDGGAANSASLNSPQGLAVGADGTVYIADTGNHRLRAVAKGIITTFAGNGTAGFSGDNASALNAQFDHPTALTIDSQGGIIVCDTNNNRIRRISGGLVTTIAGTGVQGFMGDGGAATSAQLNAPTGVTVDSSHRILIADTLNQRVRAIDSNGTITTLAGTGIAGYTGDHGAAAQARLALPTSLAVDASGDILIADTGNQRIRSVSSAGTISTVAGSGTQGLTADGAMAVAAALNRPLALTVSSAGNLIFSDSANQRVRIVEANGELFTIVPVQAVVGSQTTIQTTLNAPSPAVYGQASATVSVVVGGQAATGSVKLLEGTSVIAQSTLTNGSATMSLPLLGAGAHQLVASFAGAANNAASLSQAATLNITPATVVASANAATSFYGQSPPQLAGTSAGILAQDSASTSVSFSTAATSSSSAGTYPIAATLTGTASTDYTLTVSAASGSLTIVPAVTTIGLTTSTAPSYVGFPLLLTASLAANTPTAPSGQVQFFDGGTLVAQTNAANGVATVTYTPPASTTHAFTAAFGGSQNFAPGTSPAVAITTGALPDFSLATAAATQSVQGGSPASYALNLASTGGTFTGIVGFAVSGLPAGATASFSPPSVVPGVTGVTTTLTVQTVPLTTSLHPLRLPPTPSLSARGRTIFWAFGLGAFGVAASRRRRRMLLSALCVLLLSFGLLTAVGCGARTVASAVTPAQASQLVVTATSTNLAGLVVTHTAALTLNIH